MGRITRLLPVIVVLVLAGSGGHASAAGAPWQAGLFTSVPDSRIRADGELAVLASYGTPDGRAWDVLVQSHCGDVACYATYTIRRWDGAAWSTVGLPATGRQAFDITATGCDEDGHLVLGIDAWNPGGVESDGTIPRNDEVFLVERWDGAGFTELPATAGRLGGDIAVHGPDDIWAVAGTAVVHYDGTRWDTVSLPSGLPPLEPEQIRFAADGDVWAVGERGDAGAPGGDDVTIGLHDGGAWTTLPSPLEGAVPDGLSAGVRSAAPAGDHRLVVGVAFRDGAAPAGGELRAWNGSAWQTISAPTAAAASPQAASSLNDIWATAGSRTFHWNGSTWHAVGIGQTPRLWPGGGIWLPGDVARAAAVDNLGSRGAGYIAPIDVAAPPAGTFAVPLGRAVWLRAARATQVEDGSGFAARTIPAGGWTTSRSITLARSPCECPAR